jgi:hypothetical protein
MRGSVIAGKRSKGLDRTFGECFKHNRMANKCDSLKVVSLIATRVKTPAVQRTGETIVTDKSGHDHVCQRLV